MNEESRKILEMLSQGVISVEEASQLLEAIGSSPSDDDSEPEWDVPSDRDQFVGQVVREAVGSVRGFRQSVRPPRPPRPPRVRVGRPSSVKSEWMGDKFGDNPSFDRLVKLGMHGIGADFIKGLKDAGIKDLTFDQVLKAGMFGVNPQYLKELRETVPDLTFNEALKAAQFGVDASFIKEVRELFPEARFKDVVKAGMFGVSGDFLRELREAGLNIGLREAIKLSMHGISPTFIKDMQESGILRDFMAEGDVDAEDRLDEAEVDVGVDPDIHDGGEEK